MTNGSRFAAAFFGPGKTHAEVQGSDCDGVLIAMERLCTWRCAICGDVIEGRAGELVVIASPGQRPWPPEDPR
jgi:hypothetical protein